MVRVMANRPVGGAGFDRVVVLAGCWLGAGAWLDEWAHYRSSPAETVLTLSHGVLYSGFLAVALVFLGAVWSARARGEPRGGAVPSAYRPAVLGLAIFGTGGALDLAWHLLFGREADLAALVSPAHLLLFLGGGLVVSGPARAAWCGPDVGAESSWSARWPAMLSLVMALSTLTSVTAYANPLARPWAAVGQRTEPADLGQALGLAGVVLYAGLLMGVALLAVWRGLLPVGGLTFLFTGNAVMVVGPHGEYRFVPAALLSGLVADVLLRRWWPVPARPALWGAFALVVPAILFVLYFLALALTGGIGWPVHLWAGAVALAAVTGWLISCLIALPWLAPGGIGCGN